jgi:alkylation response protein AidB-like acyl-CoA dehydrogenase
MINHSTTELFIEDLQVDQNTLIGKEGEGFKYILSGMNAERVLIAAECIGDAQWFINQASNYANNRILFNAPISKNQGIQFPISKSYAHMKAAELMVHHAAEKFDSGVNDGESANIAKLLAADASWMAAEACLQTFGGFGFAEEYDVERKYRETRLYQVAPISTNMILSYIAEKILGMPKSYG